MSRRHAFPWALLGVVLVSTGCAPAEHDAEPTLQAASSIAGGAPAPDDDATVAIANFGDQGSGFCSGALIAPNLVLTARHCVSDADLANCATSAFDGSVAAAELAVTAVPTVHFDQPPPSRNVLEVVVSPPQTPACGNDVALLIVGSPVPDAPQAPYVPRVDERAADGEVYAALGYGGLTDEGDGVGVRRRLDDLEVLCLGAGCQVEGILSTAYIKATEFLGEHGVCSGDSGGPALDSQRRVIGVASRGPLGCGTPIYTDVEPHADLFRQTAIHAAEIGGYDPAPWVLGAPTDPTYYAPIGEACEDGAACTTGLCVDGKCSRPCTELAACDDGWTCEDEVCVPPATPTDPPPADAAPPPVAEAEDDGGCALRPPAGSTFGTGWLLIVALSMAARRRRG